MGREQRAQKKVWRWKGKGDDEIGSTTEGGKDGTICCSSLGFFPVYWHGSRHELLHAVRARASYGGGGSSWIAAFQVRSGQVTGIRPGEGQPFIPAHHQCGIVSCVEGMKPTEVCREYMTYGRPDAGKLWCVPTRRPMGGATCVDAGPSSHRNGTEKPLLAVEGYLSKIQIKSTFLLSFQPPRS